jgi:hypothetical protein
MFMFEAAMCMPLWCSKHRYECRYTRDEHWTKPCRLARNDNCKAHAVRRNTKMRPAHSIGSSSAAVLASLQRAAPQLPGYRLGVQHKMQACARGARPKKQVHKWSLPLSCLVTNASSQGSKMRVLLHGRSFWLP